MLSREGIGRLIRATVLKRNWEWAAVAVASLGGKGSQAAKALPGADTCSKGY